MLKLHKILTNPKEGELNTACANKWEIHSFNTIANPNFGRMNEHPFSNVVLLIKDVYE